MTYNMDINPLRVSQHADGKWKSKDKAEFVVFIILYSIINFCHIAIVIDINWNFFCIFQYKFRRWKNTI